MPHHSSQDRPSAPPTSPGPIPTSPGAAPGDADSLEEYHTVAETVGMVPSLRVKDNLIQAAVVIGCTAAGAGVGYWLDGGFGAAVYGAGAMIGSTLLSGLVLMILGAMRAARRKR